jgi:hypothetical protein
MKKNIMLLALGASLIAGPAMAAPAAGQMDRNADWTRAQAQTQAAERFAKMDVNKDGKFDAADRTAMRAQRGEARFAALDANKDGNISRAEWDQADTARAAKAQERRAEFAAKRGATPAGAQADGARPEMRGHGGGRGGRGGHMMRGGGFGTNGAQSVTQAEFVAQSLARFDAMDANKDGKVTAAERSAAREARGGGHGKHRSAPAGAAVQPTQ